MTGMRLAALTRDSFQTIKCVVAAGLELGGRSFRAEAVGWMGFLPRPLTIADVSAQDCSMECMVRITKQLSVLMNEHNRFKICIATDKHTEQKQIEKQKLWSGSEYLPRSL
jgi:hypothetical protein